MRYSKILIASLPLMLVGCLDVFDDSDDFYPQPAPVTVQAPAAGPVPVPTPGQRVPPPPSFKPKPPKTSDCGCPSEGTPRPTPVAPVVPCPTECSNPSGQPVDPDWHPKEGHLVQAGELVMELQRSNGNVRPSHAAMCAHIQSRMGLTAPQAELVLEEMGL